MITRRDLLRFGAMSPALHLLSARGIARRIPPAFWDDPHSPWTAPFVQELPLPRQALALSTTSGETRMDIVAEPAQLKLHPHLPASDVWRFRDGLVPKDTWDMWSLGIGPTIVARMNSPLVVRHHNDLSAGHRGFGVPNLTIHYHGGHLKTESDGFPGPVGDFDPIYRPTKWRDYFYPMCDVGTFENKVDETERPATQWYHDHLIHYTSQNVYRGLAGFFLVFDELDAGDETGRTHPDKNLRLPSGDFDLPLMICDRIIAPNGSLFYPLGNTDGCLGDKYLVNGAIQPFKQVERRKYRLRLLNACNARICAFALLDGRGRRIPFDRIGNSGGLFANPIRNQEYVLLAPAERADVVVNFADFPEGTELVLTNLLRQDSGRGPSGTYQEPDLRIQDPILKFTVRVGPAPSDPSRVPNDLRPFDKIGAQDLAAAQRTEFNFDRKNGSWVINGKADDMNAPMKVFELNKPQIWKLTNKSGGWWHPVHVHLEFMRVLKRNGKPPALDEQDGQSKKDLVLLGPNDEVEAFFRFRDFPGMWIFHCHNLEHEDHAMMARFDVQKGPL